MNRLTAFTCVRLTQHSTNTTTALAIDPRMPIATSTRRLWSNAAAAGTMDLPDVVDNSVKEADVASGSFSNVVKVVDRPTVAEDQLSVSFGATDMFAMTEPFLTYVTSHCCPLRMRT